MARKLEQFWPIKTVQHLPKRGVYCIAVASVLGLGCLVVISNRKWKHRKLLFSQQAASIDGDVAQNKKTGIAEGVHDEHDIEAHRIAHSEKKQNSGMEPTLSSTNMQQHFQSAPTIPPAHCEPAIPLAPALSEAQLAEFQARGVLVVPGALGPAAVAAARAGLRASLARRAGVAAATAETLACTAAGLRRLSSTGGAGGVLDLFYAPWKLEVAQDPRLFGIVSALWRATYAARNWGPADAADGQQLFYHPFGAFDPGRGYLYVDRVGFRVPERVAAAGAGGAPPPASQEQVLARPRKDKKKLKRRARRTSDVLQLARQEGESEPHGAGEEESGGRKADGRRGATWRGQGAAAAAAAGGGRGAPGGKRKARLQRGLTPHLDCCPDRLFASDKRVPKWRPIQAFVALTDAMEPNQGGFECAPGFHREFNEWRRRRPNPPQNPGDFSPIRAKEDAEVLKRVTHIPVPAGALVLWDVRLPHANARRNDAAVPREVVYLGYLPDVAVNRAYAEHQLRRYRAKAVPDDQWHEAGEGAVEDEPDFEFSPLGRKLMGIDRF